MKKLLMISVSLLLFLFAAGSAFSSNLSDATALREKCEKGIETLRIIIANFGDEQNRAEFKKGERLVKFGKVKFAQSKYPEAMEKYNQYLKLQHQLYKIMAQKYIDRTEKINDNVAEDLVDYIDNKRVEKYFRLASQNLSDAKKLIKGKYYTQTIITCRRSKSYAINAYKISEGKIPEKYKKDILDIEGKTK